MTCFFMDVCVWYVCVCGGEGVRGEDFGGILAVFLPQGLCTYNLHIHTHTHTHKYTRTHPSHARDIPSELPDDGVAAENTAPLCVCVCVCAYVCIYK